MPSTYLGIIGGGNMATAIIKGLIDDGLDPETILVSEPSNAQRERLAADFPRCRLADSNAIVASQSSTLILAVKPQILPAVCREIAEAVSESGPLVISIAAGVRTTDIDRWLGGGQSIVRVMPNQPALLRRGIAGLYANDATSEPKRHLALDILTAVGEVVTVEREADIDAVTAISGSGPAYVYLLIKIMIDNALAMGLDSDIARSLAVETLRGSAALAANSDASMDELIARVRSPGGTTAAALDSLEDSGVHAMFAKALAAARDRAVELADEAGKES